MNNNDITAAIATLGTYGQTILIDGKTNGNIYYGNAITIARRIRTRRANAGEHPEITVLNLSTGLITVL